MSIVDNGDFGLRRQAERDAGALGQRSPKYFAAG